MLETNNQKVKLGLIINYNANKNILEKKINFVKIVVF